MTKETKTTKPSHRLYTVTGEGETARWNDIGVAWPTKDGKGYTLSPVSYTHLDVYKRQPKIE